MKAICIPVAAMLLLVTGSPIQADVGQAPPPPHETLGVFAIAGSCASSFINIAMMLNKDPSNLAAGVGLAVGAGTMLLTAQDGESSSLGLMVAGASSIMTSLIALRYRHVLDRPTTNATVIPAWHNGGPGLALVVEFP